MHVPRPTPASAGMAATSYTPDTSSTHLQSSSSSTTTTRRSIRPASRTTKQNKDAPWIIISNGIQQIYQKNASQLSFEELYRNAYNMCLAKSGDKLYAGVRSVMTDHLTSVLHSTIMPCIPKSISPYTPSPNANDSPPPPPSSVSTSSITSTHHDITTFLRIVHETYTHHMVCLTMIRDVLMYMDRTYTKSRGVLNTYDMGVSVFRDTVLNATDPAANPSITSSTKEKPPAADTGHGIVSRYITACVVWLIHMDRHSHIIMDRMLLKTIIDMMLSIPCSDTVSTLITSTNSTLSDTSSTSMTARVHASLYSPCIHTPVISHTHTYYRTISTNMVQSTTVSNYLSRVSQYLHDEEMRVNQYMHASTWNDMKRCIEHELVLNHVQFIVTGRTESRDADEDGGVEETGLVHMMDTGNMDDMTRMYDLLGRVESGHAEIRKTICNYIKKIGAEINHVYAGIVPTTNLVQDGSGDAGTARPSTSSSSASSVSVSPQPQISPIQWTTSIITLAHITTIILTTSFQSNTTFETEFHTALEHVVWANTRSPEFLSLFLDDMFRRASKSLKPSTMASQSTTTSTLASGLLSCPIYDPPFNQSMDTIIPACINLFRYLHDKDMFSRYYKHHLAKRLLYTTHYGMDDTDMVWMMRLKVECGYQYTLKMEGMVKDVTVSSDTSSAFRDHVKQSTEPDTSDGVPDMFVYTLTSTFWPIPVPVAPTVPVTMPDTVANGITLFTRYYHSMHSGRRLTWLNHMGTADLKWLMGTGSGDGASGSRRSGKKELNVSTYGMVVLMICFNDAISSSDPSTAESESNGHTVKQIHDMTHIPIHDLHRTLLSLSLGKHRILLKQPQTRRVHQTDTYRLNTQFTSSMTKLKINTISGTIEYANPSTDTTGDNSAITLPDTQDDTFSHSHNVLETPTQHTATLSRITETRAYLLDSCIIRIMKSRNTVSHTDLVTEVIRMMVTTIRGMTKHNGGAGHDTGDGHGGGDTNGIVGIDATVIKKRIESLIDREYMSRDTNDRNLYHYIA